MKFLFPFFSLLFFISRGQNITPKNTEYNFIGNSASFIKSTHASNFITNYTICEFEDQLDIASFSLPYFTNESKFN